MTEPSRKWIAVARVVATPSGKSKPVLTEEEVKRELWAAAEFLVRSGVLDHVVELLTTLAMIHDVVTDRMVDELSKNVVKPLGLLIDSVTRSSLLEVLSNTLVDPQLEKAILEVKRGEKISLGTLTSLLSDDEVKAGLYIFLTFLKAVGRSVKRLD